MTPLNSILKNLKTSIGYSCKISGLLRFGFWINRTAPWKVGVVLSIVVDKVLFFFYHVDASSRRIDVAKLRLPHPVGVLLGGNGIRSKGRVLINAGVQFVGRMPDDPDYLARHAEGVVFDLGDNVVIGANTVLVGPVQVCDNVLIGAMSLVNQDIVESGIYVGCPAKKISGVARDVWFK